MLFDAFPATFACLLGVVAAFCTASMIGRLGFPMQPATGRAGCIDGLRGYLAILVFIGHSLIWINVIRGDGMWKNVVLYPWGGMFQCAVPTFFLVTGFLFYPRILRGFSDNNWTAIYISRAFRILPLVVASVVAISAIVALRFGIPAGYHVKEFAKAALLWISSVDEPPLFRYADSGRLNAYVFWSLWHEWVFYLVMLPALAVLMSLKPPRLPTVALPLALLVASLSLRLVNDGLLVAFIPLFALGMLAHEAKAVPRLRQMLASHAFSWVAAICLLTSAALPRDGVPVTNMILDAVVFAAIASGNSLFGLLRLKGSLVLGECSFGIYVLHGLFISSFYDGEAARHFGTDALFFAIPCLAIAIVSVSALVYVAIERPCIAMGAMLGRWISRRPPGLTPATLEVAP